MSSDRSPRRGSFLSTELGSTELPPLSAPSSGSNTDRPHRPMPENTPTPLVGRATSRLSTNPIIFPSATSDSDEYPSVLSPSPIGHSYNTWATRDVPPTQYQNQSPSSESNRFSPLPRSTAQYHEERHPIHQLFPLEHNNLTFPQATQSHVETSLTLQHPQFYPAQSGSWNTSIDPQHYPSYTGYHPTIQLPQVETASQPRVPPEQRYLPSQPPHQNSNQIRSRTGMSPGLFNQAHDFVINDPIFIDNGPDDFMTLLLRETIIGAEFDSSDSNMPLRCHPGTRTEIIKRCQNFILNRDNRPRLRWVVGAAGVGKSAIMQSVAHDETHVLSGVIVGATIFFSINGRQDGTKAITTIAYQLAVKLEPYRLFVQREATRDPSLLRKSLSRQFDKFIVEPFIHQRILDCSSRLLIIIDGLDECAGPLIQQELLGLISEFCSAYPTSPLVWMIASRPEPHITSFFSQYKVALLYEKEEILVDSDDAHADVKRYLGDKLREVKMASITLQELSQWPSEVDLLKIATASGGLFAYASTVVRYISDLDYGDPASLLDDVLEIIERGTKGNIWGRNHPMAQLDALYSHIMLRIPANVMVNTRKLLLLCLDENLAHLPFRLQCNMLGMTRNTAYGATHHIRSIAIVPCPARVLDDSLQFFHKSFPDYLRDFDRSGFSHNIKSEVELLIRHSALRIIGEASESAYMDGSSTRSSFMPGGFLKARPGAPNTISASWPAARGKGPCTIEFVMYDKVVEVIMERFSSGEEIFQSLRCTRLLTTCFTELPESFPIDAMRDFTFDECRRRELLQHGILKRIPLDKLDYDMIKYDSAIQLCFRGSVVRQRTPWYTDCKHKWQRSLEGHSQDWSTGFALTKEPSNSPGCYYCSKRFSHHFKTRQPDHMVTVLGLTPTFCLVELRFADPNDGVSDWTYRLWHGER